MGDKTILGSAAGLLVVGGGTVGRESIIWAYGKGLDWVSASIGVTQLTWLEGLPVLNIVGSLSMAAGLLLGAYAIFHRPKPAFVAVRDSAQPQSSEPSTVAEPLRYLSDAMIADGIGDNPPEFRARFACNGQNGTFYIEHSFHVGEYGGGWTLPRKIAVFHKSRFATGEVISFAIVSPGMTSEGTRWFYGPAFGADGKQATDGLNLGSHFQGRVTFLSDRNTEEHCYFIVSTTDLPEMPTVTGEHMFSHMQDWEGKQARNGSADSLFP